MNKRIGKIISLVAVVCLPFCLFFGSSSFGQALPKPGEVIEKSNIMQYKHLVPEEFLPAFENGFDLMRPVTAKVEETKPDPIPKIYQELSEKNRGKYSLDKDGYIAGGYNYEGLPFPGVTKDDKDFATKVMWNHEYRYMMDDRYTDEGMWNRRKGESLELWRLCERQMHFANRLFEPPKPLYPTPPGLRKALILQYFEPVVQRNFMMLSYRYLDQRRADDTYLYLPSMRRVLRGESGVRSTPVQGVIQAQDDFELFDGRVPEFTYTFVGEQKVLAMADFQQSYEELKKEKSDIPFVKDNWEVRDVYIIDITAKDPKYPQSKKRIYLDKENMSNIYYAFAWDRAGKLWKVWLGFDKRIALPNGDNLPNFMGMFGCDLQFGMASYLAFWNMKVDNQGFKYNDFTESALIKLAR